MGEMIFHYKHMFPFSLCYTLFIRPIDFATGWETFFALPNDSSI